MTHDMIMNWYEFFIARKGHRKARWRKKFDREYKRFEKWKLNT